jgi:aspartyl-tRNA(Asn)/glutamyl-tRNA(Gln) amidotransferase subunit B
VENFKIKSEDIEFYLQNPEFGKIFDEASEILGNRSDEKSFKLLSNYISSDLIGFEKDKNVEGKLENISGKNLADLVNLISDGDLSSRGAKDTLEILYKNSGETKEIAEKNNLIQKSDEGELKIVVEKIISENPEQAENYRNGEEKLLQFFVGQGMKATQGSANPGLLAKLFKENL